MAKTFRGPGDDTGPVVWMHGDGTVTDVTYQGVSLRNWVTGVALKSSPDRMTMVDLSLVITQVRIIDAPPAAPSLDKPAPDGRDRNGEPLNHTARECPQRIEVTTATDPDRVWLHGDCENPVGVPSPATRDQP